MNETKLTDEYFANCKKTSWMTKEFNWHWYTINNRKEIGDMSYLYHKYKPTSYKDFYIKYTTDTGDDGDVRHRGRSEQELLQLAHKYQRISKRYDLPISTFYNNLVWHIIIQSYDGHKYEQQFINYINSLGYNAVTVNSNLDAEYGVDIEVFNDKKRLFFVQVKPITFTIGNKNASLINDRKLAYIKRDKIKEKYNVPVLLVCYSINKVSKEVEWLQHNNGKCLFKFEELFNADGTVN